MVLKRSYKFSVFEVFLWGKKQDDKTNMFQTFLKVNFVSRWEGNSPNIESIQMLSWSLLRKKLLDCYARSFFVTRSHLHASWLFKKMQLQIVHIFFEDAEKEIT